VWNLLHVIFLALRILRKLPDFGKCVCILEWEYNFKIGLRMNKERTAVNNLRIGLLQI
jgi:hypothetical protein